MSEFQTVAMVGDIPEGEGRAFEFNDRLVAVFFENGDYHAIDDMCPHMGASLASGHLEDGAVACPWHGWRFDVQDGSWCDNRRLKIDAFDVRVVGNEIQIAARESNQPQDQAAGSPLGAPAPSQPPIATSEPPLNQQERPASDLAAGSEDE